MVSVAAWQAVSDPEQRRELHARLKDMVAEQVDAEIARLGERVAGLRSDPAGEVDRRLNDLRERYDRRASRHEGRGQRKHEEDEGGKRRPPPRRP